MTLWLQHGGDGLALVVVLYDESQIEHATLKRYRFANDTSTYKRKNRMRQALRGKTVTAFDTGSRGQPVLVIGAKRFEIDPTGDAFVEHPRDPDEGCGC